MKKKIAIILFNLGGPDSPEAVQPFLKNLFSDPAIIRVPLPVRWLLARIISSRRSETAKEIYAQIGGKSPLLEQTQAQAQALEKTLKENDSATEHRVFICMRYWHPMSEETVGQVKEYAPDEMILLPLYPQFSTTTTASSFADWKQAAKKAGLGKIPTQSICCYPEQDKFIDAYVTRVKAICEPLRQLEKFRLLFSAHGLPKKVVEDGDPYQWQVERSALSIFGRLELDNAEPVVCYQSKVGPLEWIGPSTEDEIARAGKDGLPVVVVPLAFVSEHSETLVELDIEYRELAEKAGVPAYHRVPTVETETAFIDGLAALCSAENTAGSVCSFLGRRICPEHFRRCPHS